MMPVIVHGLYSSRVHFNRSSGRTIEYSLLSEFLCPI